MLLRAHLAWPCSPPGLGATARSASFNLPSVAAEEEVQGKMPPIKVKFEIPYFTVSGLQVGCGAAGGAQRAEGQGSDCRWGTAAHAGRRAGQRLWAFG